jgi:hypothetical protein
MLDFLRGIWYNIGGGRAAGGDRTIYTRPTGQISYENAYIRRKI